MEDLLSLFAERTRIYGIPGNDTPCMMIRVETGCLPEQKKAVEKALNFVNWFFLEGHVHFNKDQLNILHKYHLVATEYAGVEVIHDGSPDSIHAFNLFSRFWKK